MGGGGRVERERKSEVRPELGGSILQTRHVDFKFQAPGAKENPDKL